jgi:hypothetical protein
MKPSVRKHIYIFYFILFYFTIITIIIDFNYITLNFEMQGTIFFSKM